MVTSSLFNIKIDLSRSHGSYLYDLNTKREVFDLFSMYSSLPLGYNHSAFARQDFLEEVRDHSVVKVTNCEFDSPAAEQFRDEFTSHPSMRPFSHFHFCCTGALAVEAAVKTAMCIRGNKLVATLLNSFQGINGYGGLLAATPGPAILRLEGFPRGTLTQVFDPQALLDTFQFFSHRFSAVLIEPIQCTAGDRVVPVEALRLLRTLCDEAYIPLIFDEIQTGFGSTGSMWYFEQLGIVPDIVIFGKKTQVSGIMVREQFAQIFKQPARLAVTWNGNALDMIRCRAILGAYESEKILDNVRWRGEQLQKGLTNAGLAVRRVGLLLAVDFDSVAARDSFVARMWHDEATIMIPTGERSVRLRPNLAITAAEANDAVRRASRVMKAVAT